MQSLPGALSEKAPRGFGPPFLWDVRDPIRFLMPYHDDVLNEGLDIIESCLESLV